MFKVRNWLVMLGIVLLIAVPVLAQDSSEYTVSLGNTDDLGSFLVGPNGMTLYLFSIDPLNKSFCNDQCAIHWPPLTVDSADGLTAAEGIPGNLSVITRGDGTLQVAYNGIALYYWESDSEVGETTGNRVGNVWWVVSPATVYIEPQGALGLILAGPTGLTVYTNDEDSMDMSTCVDQCATNWPPLTVDSADSIVAGVNLPGTLGTIERADGTLQVTYNGMPLYNWKDDKAPGDASGDGLGDKWHVVAPETVVVGNNATLGEILISNIGLTVYTFSNDSEGVSNCVDDCAKNWPPVTVGANDKLVTGAGVSGTLATITRADKKIQLTYNGMPLYYFKDDLLPGDTNGQGVGGKWAVVNPM